MSKTEEKIEETSIEERVEFFQSLSSVRGQSQIIFDFVANGDSQYFQIEEEKIGEVASFVENLMESDYGGDLNKIPFHSRYRHFEAGGEDRLSSLRSEWEDVEDMERCRRLLDLVVVSVLLDAGAGPHWKFDEPNSGLFFAFILTNNKWSRITIYQIRRIGCGFISHV